MERFKKMLFSMSLTGMLLMLFAISIGVATFIENDFGTVASKAFVYNTFWFEFMLLLLAVNMIGNIFKFKMYRKEKIGVFIFHISFLLILVGAAVTRYISYEGVMPIREGSVSNQVISNDTYLIAKIYDGEHQKELEDKTLFTSVTNNYFNKKFAFKNSTVAIVYKDFIPNAAESIVETSNGKPILVLITTGEDGRKTVFLKDKEHKSINDLHFEFNPIASDSGSVQIKQQGDSLLFKAPHDVWFMSMLDRSEDTLKRNIWHPFEKKRLHNIGGVSIVLKNYYKTAETELISAAPDKSRDQNTEDALIVTVFSNGEEQEVTLMGGAGFEGRKKTIALGGLSFDLKYGAKTFSIPFAIKLNDFQLERYAGSMSPASYASEVTLLDPDNEIEENHRIYMNNVLQYGGFRFFQSSYDQDEKGTVLSVNHDVWGTNITYLGYFIMGLGMFLSFFSKKSRFALLSKKIAQARASRKAAASLVLLLAFGLMTFSSHQAEAQISKLDTLGTISKKHAADFGGTLVQTKGGRMKPINTFASEILRKVTKKETFLDRTPEQVMLGMLTYPSIWQGVPMIQVKDPRVQVKQTELQKILGVTTRYAAFQDFFDTQFNYKLGKYSEEAHQKQPASRSLFDKEVIAVSERINICYMLYSDNLLSLFPKKDDPSKKWYTATEGTKLDLEEGPAAFVKGFFVLYTNGIKKGMKTGDWKEADEWLGYLKKYQEDTGKEVMPPVAKINAEITYNNLHIFKNLSRFYFLVGFVLLILLFVNILKPNLKIGIPIKVGTGLLFAAFLFHIFGLGLRWYISGHAPWSNGYESMIYIAFATMLAGFIFSRQSPIAVAATAILASLILWVAGLSWLDPEITNLVPVLKSYWLTIHVSMITASYGFLALACLLGFLSLLLMIIKTENSRKNINLTVKEMTYIIELTITIGLFMLTIGTFLGGVWANESWGRYWGWDAKETWALVSVLVYSFILHVRFIPGLKGIFTLNFLAVVGYASIIMTYFGVNYYLSGLHSYAAGDSVPVPTFVYYTIVIVGAVSALAYWRENAEKTAKKAKKE